MMRIVTGILVFSEDAARLCHCIHCGEPTNTYRNCINGGCRDMVLICDDCVADPATAHCGRQECREFATSAAAAVNGSTITSG